MKLRAPTLQEYLDRSTRLLPALEQLTLALESEYECTGYLNLYRSLKVLTPPKAYRYHMLMTEMDSLGNSTHLTSEEKLRRIDGIEAEFREIDVGWGLMCAELARCWMFEKTDEPGRGKVALKRAIVLARDVGESMTLCQSLGTLAVRHGNDGEVDSMLACYDEMREVAYRCRFGSQAARVNGFLAAYYSLDGRKGLAHDLYLEAEAICEQFKGGAWRARWIVVTARFYESLGCTESVTRQIERGRALLEGPRAGFNSSRKDLEVDLLAMEAHNLLRRGELAAGEAVYDRIRESVRRRSNRTHYAGLLREEGEGLLGCGQYGWAAAVAREGLEYCELERVGELMPAFQILRARALFESGPTQFVEEALLAFENLSPDSTRRQLWIERDALKARVEMKKGNRLGARRELQLGWSRLCDYLAHTEPGPEGYLFLSGCQSLRLAMLDAVSDDPMAAYAAELQWRSLANWLGRAGEVGGAGLKPPAFPLDEKRLLRGRWKQPGIHLLYVARADRLDRFTVSGQGCVLDRLPVTTAQVQQRVTSVIDRMRNRRGEALDTELGAELDQLGLLLLPSSVRRRNRETPSNLYISPDGPLASLPFEMIGTGDSAGYRPLIEDYDVAYVRGGRARPPAAPGSVSIVADPAVSPELKRKFPFLGGLEHGREEAELVASHFPGASSLIGSAATKAAIMESWRNASMIFVAAHLVRNPDAPFLSYFPVASLEASNQISASTIDFKDIRSQPLGHCGLVVLSGCSTGAPFVSGERVGPSMGDAFLDAGAAVVVQTFWPVEDREAQLFAGEFLEAMRENGGDPVKAVNAVQRLKYGTSNSADPRNWSGYSVGVRGL